MSPTELRKRGSEVAIKSFSEAQGGAPSFLPWDELEDRTCRTANAFKHAGVRKGHVIVCMFMISQPLEKLLLLTLSDIGANTPIPVIAQHTASMKPNTA